MSDLMPSSEINTQKPAISFRGVNKIYRLYSDLLDQSLNALGLTKIAWWRKPSFQEFYALKDIDLEVQTGERIGIVGRNGAGKTTMLKLVTGNFGPTSGTVEINGKVQALMQTGLGFHQEFTGMENIRSALLYNGLSGKEYDDALNDIIDFVELGDFIDQPLKSYSLGMQARLQFAAATAIQPDILIIDEVLGAGDSYFSMKSSDRMERLTSSGCTLLLVSHSSQQILQFCDRAIWIEGGEIVKSGDSLSVVKAYEEFTHKLREEGKKEGAKSYVAAATVSESKWLRQKLLQSVLGSEVGGSSLKSKVASSGGVSRWGGEGKLKIEEVNIRDANNNVVSVVHTGDTFDIELKYIAEESGEYAVTYVIVLFTADGKYLTRHCSGSTLVSMEANEERTVLLHYEENLLGGGEYIFSAALYRELDLANLGDAKCYDLLSRSFGFEVVGRYLDDMTLFHHPADWREVVSDCREGEI